METNLLADPHIWLFLFLFLLFSFYDIWYRKDSMKVVSWTDIPNKWYQSRWYYNTYMRSWSLGWHYLMSGLICNELELEFARLAIVRDCGLVLFSLKLDLWCGLLHLIVGRSALVSEKWLTQMTHTQILPSNSQARSGLLTSDNGGCLLGEPFLAIGHIVGFLQVLMHVDLKNFLNPKCSKKLD